MFVRSVEFWSNSNWSTVVGGGFLRSSPASLVSHFDLTTTVQAIGFLQDLFAHSLDLCLSQTYFPLQQSSGLSMSLKEIWEEGLESDLWFGLRKGRLQPSWQVQDHRVLLTPCGLHRLQTLALHTPNGWGIIWEYPIYSTTLVQNRKDLHFKKDPWKFQRGCYWYLLRSPAPLYISEQPRPGAVSEWILFPSRDKSILCERWIAARNKNFALYQKLASSCFSWGGSLQSLCTFTFFSIAVLEKAGEVEGKSPKFPLCAWFPGCF